MSSKPTWRDAAVKHVDALHAIACDTSAGLTIAEHRELTSATRQIRAWLGSDGVERHDAATAIADEINTKDAEIARLRSALNRLHALYLDAAEPEAEHIPRWLRDALNGEVTR